ncbi:hypothetical protein [Salinibacterium sp. ZJ77]|uniref:hypothetical protein n=1 Tax=Salinibacterium sp. ZJ77 TaxID=2708337 RepID=UPI00141EDD79|nr:hypothetical protein [Salinibacterium sp. ZJ77]
MMSHDNPRSGRRSAAPRTRRPRWIAVAIAAAAAVVAALVAVLIWSPWSVRTVEIGGLEYRTNIELREGDSGVYAFMPVNTDTTEVVLETGDQQKDSVIRSFLERLDTFVPGEHVLEMDEAPTIRVIIDGIEGESGSVLEQLDSSRE